MTANDQRTTRRWVWLIVAVAAVIAVLAGLYRNHGYSNVTPTLGESSTLAAPVRH